MIFTIASVSASDVNDTVIASDANDNACSRNRRCTK